MHICVSAASRMCLRSSVNSGLDCMLTSGKENVISLTVIIYLLFFGTCTVITSVILQLGQRTSEYFFFKNRTLDVSNELMCWSLISKLYCRCSLF